MENQEMEIYKAKLMYSAYKYEIDTYDKLKNNILYMLICSLVLLIAETKCLHDNIFSYLNLFFGVLISLSWINLSVSRKIMTFDFTNFKVGKVKDGKIINIDDSYFLEKLEITLNYIIKHLRITIAKIRKMYDINLFLMMINILIFVVTIVFK